MPQMINIHEAKTRLSQLLQQVEEGEEIIILRANKPITRLIAHQEKAAPRRLGEAKGLVTILANFDDLPDDFMAHFQ